MCGSCLSDKSLKPLELSRVRRTGKPNDALYADGPDVSGTRTDGGAVFVPAKVMAEVRSVIRSYAADEMGGVERGITDSSGLYVIRTKTMGFPDGLYFWLEEAEGGVKVSLYARSVYGYKDWGVSRSRLDALVKRLGAPLDKKEK